MLYCYKCYQLAPVQFFLVVIQLAQILPLFPFQHHTVFDAYTDLSQAFDTDIHSILLRKSHCLGIHFSFLLWVRSYISSVYIENTKTYSFAVTSRYHPWPSRDFLDVGESFNGGLTFIITLTEPSPNLFLNILSSGIMVAIPKVSTYVLA